MKGVKTLYTPVSLRWQDAQDTLRKQGIPQAIILTTDKLLMEAAAEQKTSQLKEGLLASHAPSLSASMRRIR